jgi:hypothetical protein
MLTGSLSKSKIIGRISLYPEDKKVELKILEKMIDNVSEQYCTASTKGKGDLRNSDLWTTIWSTYAEVSSKVQSTLFSSFPSSFFPDFKTFLSG